jgi:hypothetical protein
MIDAEDVQDWLENLDNYGMGDGYWIPSKESFEALCQLVLDRLNRPEGGTTAEYDPVNDKCRGECDCSIGQTCKAYLAHKGKRPQEERGIEWAIFDKAMERYRIWAEENPEGPIMPNDPGGIRHKSGYELILLCAEYAKRLDAQRPQKDER